MLALAENSAVARPRISKTALRAFGNFSHACVGDFRFQVCGTRRENACIYDESAPGNTQQPFGFAGGLHDRDTGLVRFGVRDYDRWTGRWTSRDPILFAGGQANLYAYFDNEPVNLTDPIGLVNPTKVAAAVLSAANAGRLYASGMLKLGAAAGVDITGVGAAPGALVGALGFWNLKSAGSAKASSEQLLREALAGKWEDASARNLLGALPFGTNYDDPCEPMPWDFARDKAQALLNKPAELLIELGKAL